MTYEKTGRITDCPKCQKPIPVKKDQEGDHSVTCRKCGRNGTGRTAEAALREFRSTKAKK